MFNAVLFKSCGNGIHGRCAKIKLVTNTLAIDLICAKSKGCHENVDQKEKLHDDGDTVTDFSYLGDFIYLVGVCEVAVTSRTRYGLAKCRHCQDLLCGKNSSENQRKRTQKLCEISKALWKRDMVPRPE